MEEPEAERGGGEEPFIADMLRTEGAALRHTAGVTREPAPNLVGLPCRVRS